MKNKIFKKSIFLGLFLYVCFIFISQESDLHTYKQQSDYYNMQIAKEKENREEMLKQKENTDSDAYIEQVAREKLNLYKPNEIVYIDTSK